MTHKTSKHTKSFAWLFGIALFGAVFALIVTWQLSYPQDYLQNSDYSVVTYPTQADATKPQPEPEVQIDTSFWEEYYDVSYGLKFKYDPEWKVRSIKNKDGYYVIEIDPGARYDNFRVYISKDDYFALSGVPTSKTQVGGKEALNLDGQVLGVKDNATYFTFDMGASLSLKPFFQAMVKTVEFVPATND